MSEEHRKVLREVALAYPRVMRAPQEPAVTRAEILRRDQKRQSEALAGGDGGVSAAKSVGSL
jgi:hypothetical protein